MIHPQANTDHGDLPDLLTACVYFAFTKSSAGG
jgi:hypothetical protein